jgi:hypothetical protein
MPMETSPRPSVQPRGWLVVRMRLPLFRNQVGRRDSSKWDPLSIWIRQSITTHWSVTRGPPLFGWPRQCANTAEASIPSEPLNSHEERNPTMHHEFSGSRLHVQPALGRRRRPRELVRSLRASIWEPTFQCLWSPACSCDGVFVRHRRQQSMNQAGLMWDAIQGDLRSQVQQGGGHAA